MITNIFGDSLEVREIVKALILGSENGGEYVAYGDYRGTLSYLRITPDQTDVIEQVDEEFGSELYDIEDVEEAVETFLGYVEMHEKADLPVSGLFR